MSRLPRFWPLLGIALWLGGCSTTTYTPNYLPGDAVFYSVGSMQDEEYFNGNIKRLQSTYPFYSTHRFWEDEDGKPEPASRNMLRVYYPLSVRYELKDGRQFIAENIDIAAMMREYLTMNDIKMQWQVEDRPRTLGDFDPSLVYEVREDEVTIKWLLRYNKVPVAERGAKLPEVEYVQVRIATVKATPATEIDFNKQWEVAAK